MYCLSSFLEVTTVLVTLSSYILATLAYEQAEPLIASIIIPVPSVASSSAAATSNFPATSTSSPSTDGNSVFNCSGPLPMTDYPNNLERTDFLSLVDLCGWGCTCGDGSSSNPTCNSSSEKIPDFNATAGLKKACLNGCSCLTTSQYNANPPASSYNKTLATPTCSNGPIPSGTDITTLRSLSNIVNLTCFNDPWTSINTIVNNTFNYTAAQLCDPCPSGYGPDPDCKPQPVPLPTCNTQGVVTTSEQTIATSKSRRRRRSAAN